MILLVLSIAVWLGCGGEKMQPASVSFSADMTEQIQSNVFMSKIYVKGDKYRMVQHDQGETLYVVVDQVAGKTRVLVPSQKQYLEIGSQDMMSLMNDPFQSLKYALTMAEKEVKGQDKVGDYECERATLTIQDTEAMTYWMSTELNFPLKIIMQGQEARSIELTNIKAEELDDALFTIPEGYTKMVPPGEQPLEIPEWAEQYESHPLLGVPVENIAMKPGEMFRVKVIPETALKISGVNTGQVSAAFTAVPFKDGKPIKDPAMSSISFAETGMGGGFTFEETPYEADEVVVHIDEGEFNISVEKINVGPGREIAEDRVYGLTVIPNKEIRMRFVNLNDSESQCVIVYSKNGEELDEAKVGPESQRTFLFNTLYQSRSRNATVDCDQVEVRVTKGKVLVNIRQPE